MPESWFKTQIKHNHRQTSDTEQYFNIVALLTCTCYSPRLQTSLRQRVTLLLSRGWNSLLRFICFFLFFCCKFNGCTADVAHKDDLWWWVLASIYKSSYRIPSVAREELSKEKLILKTSLGLSLASAWKQHLFPPITKLGHGVWRMFSEAWPCLNILQIRTPHPHWGFYIQITMSRFWIISCNKTTAFNVNVFHCSMNESRWWPPMSG